MVKKGEIKAEKRGAHTKGGKVKEKEEIYDALKRKRGKI